MRRLEGRRVRALASVSHNSLRVENCEKDDPRSNGTLLPCWTLIDIKHNICGANMAYFVDKGRHASDPNAI